MNRKAAQHSVIAMTGHNTISDVDVRAANERADKKIILTQCGTYNSDIVLLICPFYVIGLVQERCFCLNNGAILARHRA